MSAPATVGDRCTVYVPCDVASIRARLGYAETVTPVEQIVLQAVHAGADTLPDLCTDLGFSRRMAVDLVHDLWQAKYLRLVRSYAGLEVSSEIARLIAAGRLGDLPSAETVVEARPVMIDKLSGYVLPVPARGPSTPRDRSLAVPVENSAIRIHDAALADIVAAVESGLRADWQDLPDGPGRALRRVLAAYVEDSEGTTRGRRWLPLDVRPVLEPDLNPDTDRLVVTVVDEVLPVGYREEAGRALTRLVAARPDDEFTRALRGRARIGLLEAASLATEVVRLTQLAQRAAGTVAGQRLTTHGELESSLSRVRGLMREHLEQEVDATLVIADDHGRALSGLMDAARSQLVLTGPWMREGGLTALEEDLESAITRRNVQVCLLWGIRHGDVKDRGAGNFLYQFTLRTGARPYGSLVDEGPDAPDGDGAAKVEPVPAARLPAPPGGRRPPAPKAPWLLVPPESSRTHAKVAVSDARAALVTSWNFLSKADAHREIGVVVRAPTGSGTGPTRDLLRWARSLPGYEMSRQMLVEERAFALADPAGRPDDPEPDLPVLPTPDQPPGEGLDESTLSAVRQWAENWSATATTIQRWLLGRSLPTAAVLVDAEHRQALWSALRQARDRLLIVSHRLSSEVVDDRFLQALESALNRGVKIRIQYAEPHTEDALDPGNPGGDTTMAERSLADLAERFPGRLVVHRTDTHAKVLLWDDVAVIGSFNYLSHEGTFSSRNVHRQRSEVSLRLSGAAFADDVARWAGFAVTARPEGPALPAPVFDPLIAEAQRLLNALTEHQDAAEVVERHLASCEQPWQLLDRLDNPPRAVLRIAAALCLSRWPADAPPGRRVHWHRWLVQDLWASGAYLEAAVLRSALEDDTTRPRAPIAVLAAARNGPQYATAFLDAYLEQPSVPEGDGPLRLDLTDVTAGEHSALMATAAELVLFQADSSAAEVLAEYQAMLARPQETTDMKSLVPVWKQLIDVTLDYFQESSGRPLPLNRIRALTSQGDAPLAAARLWDAIRTGIRRATETQLANTHSQRTLHELMRSGGGKVGALRDIAERENRSQLADWVAQAPTAENGFGRWIDQAGQRVDPSRPAMHSTHRRKVIRDLMQIARDARRLSRLPEPVDVATPSAEEVAVLAAARRCAAVCAEVLPLMMLDADPPDAGVPETRLVHEVLRALVPLEAWHHAENPRVEESSARPEVRTDVDA